jgi:hypothetical protein
MVMAAKEQEIHETFIDLERNINGAYSFSYRPSYRDRVLADIIEEVSDKDTPPVLIEALRKYLNMLVSENPLALTDDSLTLRAYDFKAGWEACEDYFGVTATPAQ